jgi:hypothetical protein
MIFENKKAEPKSRPVQRWSRLYTLPAPKSMPTLLWESRKSRHHRRRCCHGGVDAAGRDEQQVEGRGRLHALASMRAPPQPLGEGAPGSSPAPSSSRTREAIEVVGGGGHWGHAALLSRGHAGGGDPRIQATLLHWHDHDAAPHLPSSPPPSRSAVACGGEPEATDGGRLAAMGGSMTDHSWWRTAGSGGWRATCGSGCLLLLLNMNEIEGDLRVGDSGLGGGGLRFLGPVWATLGIYIRSHVGP